MATTLVGALVACGPSTTDDDEQAEADFADASFKIEESSDCVEAFDGRFLSRLAEERDWTEDDIDAFCTELADIADEYATDDSTLTTVTFAGVG